MPTTDSLIKTIRPLTYRKRSLTIVFEEKLSIVMAKMDAARIPRIPECWALDSTTQTIEFNLEFTLGPAVVLYGDEECVTIERPGYSRVQYIPTKHIRTILPDATEAVLR